eukprot:8134396-Lingulodinium_polyedra.AAC.1
MACATRDRGSEHAMETNKTRLDGALLHARRLETRLDARKPIRMTALSWSKAGPGVHNVSGH